MKPHGRKLVLTPTPPFPSYLSPPPPESNRNSFYSNPAFLVLVYVITLVLIKACFRSCELCSDQHSNRGTTSSPALDHSPRSNLRKGLDPTVVQALPEHSYNADVKYQVDCAICLSEFEEGEAMKMIPFCQHVFHPVCINSWLSSHETCPVCRTTQFYVEEGKTAEEASNVGNFSVGSVVENREL